ncbi:carboxypeptidase-like regulatory domain-containing protein [Nocardioides sp. URHA0020]|uniref:carboxypeptidase-like regulatory domain-containing protein n=1 Tax=Nocardioides sp. URHA0020 TaxID=1380392 RepID=UPI0006842CAA|nr:carboxypeptidase-like regulatory domain-containing protein [Nocardioides sp. URHA0020]
MTPGHPISEPAPGLVVSTLLRTAAGSPLPVEVTLTNNAASPRVLVVGALGVDAAWLPAPVRTGVLEPGQSIIVTLIVSPSLGTVPGHYPFAFTVQALDPLTGRPAGSAVVMVDSAIVVNPRNQLTLELRPRSISTVSSRKVMLSLRNTGAEPARVTLEVQTSPRVRVRFRKKVVEVLPGATEQVRGRATVTHRRLFGGDSNHTYTVSASGTESLRHVEGSVTQHPLVGTMLMKAVALLSVLAIWIGAAVIFIPQLAHRIGDRSSETSTSSAGGGDGQDSQDSPGSDDSGSGGSDGGSGSGGSDDKAGGAGGAGDKGDKGGKGGTEPAVATDKSVTALSGTVAGEAPAGVRVSLEPTSLVDEDAQGGVGVGVPSPQLAKTGMSLASSFLNRALPTTPPNRTATTTTDGSWAFAGVKKPGYYLLTFSKRGFQKQSFVVDSTSEASAKPLEVTLAAGQGTLSGTVTGPRGKVGAATVTITDGTNTITTSSNSRGRIGHWAVKGLSTPGDYVVQAAKPGLSSESRMVRLSAGGSATADLGLRYGVGSLVGKVRSTNESGELTGVGGATVTVTSEDGAVRTATTLTRGAASARGSSARVGADFVGTYTVPGLPVPATYTVTITGAGLQTQTSKVRFKRGQSRASTGADLTSSSGSVAGTITGLDTDGDRSGVVGAGMTLSNADNTYKTMSTSQPSGGYLFAGVEPGTYSLETKFFGFVSDHVTVTVRAGRTATADRQISEVEGGVLAARSAVQGRAIDGSTGLAINCPVGDDDCVVADVVDRGVDEGPADDRAYDITFLPTDEFTLPDPLKDPAGGLLPGMHTVTVSAPHYSSTRTKIRVGADETANLGTVALLPAPKIVGTITAVTGSPTGRTCVFAVAQGGAAPAAGCDTSSSGGAHACQADDATFTDVSTDRVCAFIAGGTGSYSIEVPAEGTYTIYVQSADVEYVAPHPAGVLLEAGVSRNQSYVLNRLGRVLVSVRRTGSTGGLVPAVGSVIGPVPGGGTPVPSTAKTDVNGAMQFKGVAPGTYTISSDLDPSRTTTFSVGLNQDQPARINLTSPIDAAVGQVRSSVDGVTTSVEQATVRVTAPIDYDADDSIVRDTVEMKTTSQGCFIIEKSLSESPAVPGAGGCSWPVGPDPSRGKMTFLSPVTTSVYLWAPGYVEDTRPNVTLTTGSTLNSFTLAPLPVPLGTVQPVLDATAPADPVFDWSQVAFSAAPAAGPTNAISVRATGTGSGALTWTDNRLPGTTDMLIPGHYTITATRAGYLSDTEELTCPLATTSLIRCSWTDDPITMTKLSSLEVTALDGATPVLGATYVLTHGAETRTLTAAADAGSVTFTGLDPSYDDDYKVEIRAAGYAFDDTDTLPLACTPEPTGSLHFELVPGTTTSCAATLTRLGVISGTLKGVPGLPPASLPETGLVNAPVTAQECTAINTDGDCTAVTGPVFPGTTGAGGAFSITGTADDAGLDTAKDWLVRATVAGYSLPPAPGAIRGVVVEGSDFVAGTASAALTMRLDAVNASVVLTINNVPITGTASVDLMTLDENNQLVPVQSAVRGTSAFTLTGVIPGAYVIRVSGGGLQAQTQSATISTTGQIITITVVRISNVARATITADAPAGALAGADVSICPTEDCDSVLAGSDTVALSKTTDAAGGVVFRTVPDGDYWVKVTKTGYRPQTLGPFEFDYLIGDLPLITAQMVQVKRTVTITVKRSWSNDALTGGTVSLQQGSKTLAPVPLTASGSDLSATFNQVTWGCWTVTLTRPDRHLGTVGSLQDRPTDPDIASCSASDEMKVPSTDDDTAATASLSIDEGRIDVTVAATPEPSFGHAAPAMKVTIKSGSNVVYTQSPFTLGTLDVWLPTGKTYTVRAEPVTADAFWPADQTDVPLPATKPAGDAKIASLSLVEKSAKLNVDVSGNGPGGAVLTLTPPAGESVPAAYLPSVTTGADGKYTLTLPGGEWSVKASVTGDDDEDTITLAAPQTYTLPALTVKLPATGATAGKPGAFTPAGSKIPADRAALAGVTASPATPWTSGQRVVLASGTAHWDGTAWVAGSAP